MANTIFQTHYKTADLLTALNNSLKDKECISKQTLTVAGTAVGLTVPNGAGSALIIVESSISTPAIRYWECDVAPTTTTGIPRSNLDAFVITNYQNLKRVKFIQVAGGVHTLQVQFYR